MHWVSGILSWVTGVIKPDGGNMANKKLVWVMVIYSDYLSVVMVTDQVFAYDIVLGDWEPEDPMDWGGRNVWIVDPDEDMEDGVVLITWSKKWISRFIVLGLLE